MQEEFRELLYADQSLERWSAVDERFGAAAATIEAGNVAGAVALLLPIAEDTERESRVRLVAWTALRSVGVGPAAEDAATVLGVVLEVPMHGGRDTLAAYADGRARYVNYTGAATILEPASGGAEPLVAELVARAQTVAHAIGPWIGPRPPLPDGACRLSMLCPGGLFFGQGGLDELSRDPMAGPVLALGAQLVGALPSPGAAA